MAEGIAVDRAGGDLDRRSLLAGSASLLALGPAAAGAQETYPARRITMLLGFAAGSGADIGARFVAAELQNACGQPVIVENRPGAGSNIAVTLASQAKPDGYTVLLAASSAMAGSRFLYRDFKVDTEKDFEPVAALWEATFLIVVAPDSPLNSIADLTARLKSKPASLYGFTNQTGQLTAAYYLTQAGASAQAVSYRATTDAVADLGNGALDFMAIDGAFAAGQIRAGKIKALAVTTPGRVAPLPDVPTMSEAGLKDFVFAPFWALYAPRGTPAPIVKTLENHLREIYASEAARKQHAVSGSNIAFADGPGLRAKLRKEIDRWAGAVKAAGVEPI
jgi:tripartite-type tricarboxylate transporter receptor subunit TctC